MTYLGTQAEDLSSPPLPYAKICVVGAGSWGTALASVARRAGRETSIWGRDKATVEAINTRGENPKYLPGIPLPIRESVYRILHQDADVRDTFAEFWSRPIEGERRGLSISMDHPIAMAAETAE